MSKLQGAEFEDKESVRKYMTKSEIEEQRSSLLIMTQRLYFILLQHGQTNEHEVTQCHTYDTYDYAYANHVLLFDKTRRVRKSIGRCRDGQAHCE